MSTTPLTPPPVASTSEQPTPPVTSENTASQSTEFTIPSIPEPARNPVNSFSEMVPEAYRGKDYLTEFMASDNPMENLLKRYEEVSSKANAPSIPKPDASDEEWEKYYGLTRPESKDAYTFQDFQIPEEKKNLAPLFNYGREENLAKAKELMHKHGLTKKQAESLVKDYESFQFESLDKMTKQQHEQSVKDHQEFLSILGKSFGQETDQVLSSAKEHMFNKIPPNLQKYAEAMSNEQLAVTLALVHNVTKDKLKEDNFLGIKGQSATPGLTKQNAAAEIKRLQSNPAFKNKFDPEHKHIMDQYSKASEILWA